MAFDRPASAAQRPRHRLRAFATALTALFAAVAGVGVVLAGAHVWRARVFDRRAEGRLVQDVVVSEAEVEVAETVVVVMSVVWWLLVVVTAAVFLVWQFRHAQNARALGAVGGLSHPAWAVGAWLVPIGNVILGPRQIYRSRAPGVGRTTLVIRTITWWAMALALAGLVLWPANGLWVDGAQTRYDFLRNSTADYMIAFAALTAAAAAGCALYIVRSLSARQDDVLARWAVTTGEPAESSAEHG